MRWMASCVLASSILFLSVPPSHAEFLLNCRLMDHRHSFYENYCLGDQDSLLVVARCSERGYCVIKRQNFKGAYYSENTAAERSFAELSNTAQAVGTKAGLSAVNSVQSAAAGVRSLADKSVRSLAGQ
jgi:hypothetical protein